MTQKAYFTWDIHYSCNYNCTYCFLSFEQETASIQAEYLSLGQWVDIWTDIYRKYGSCHVLVTGGEPFIYPAFIDLISEVSKMHTFSFSTNLSWDVDEFTGKVAKERVVIESSFHPEFISAEEFVEKVNILRDRDYFISVTIVAYPPFLDKIPEYKDIFKKEKIRLNLYPYRGPCNSKTYPEAYSDSERAILSRLGLEIGTKSGKVLMEVYDTKGRADTASKTDGTKKLCRMGQRYAKIVPSGEAYRCCAAVNKTWGSLGNVIHGSFNLLDDPEACPDFSNCRCYKSMVLGEEDRWKTYWKTPEQFRKEREKGRELEKTKTLRNEGRLDEAIVRIQGILGESPDDAGALTLLGEIYLAQKAFDASEMVLLKALEKNTDPDNVSWICRTLGKVYCEFAILHGSDPAIKEERISRSLDYLNKAVESTKESNNLVDKAWAHYEIAVTYYHQKEYGAAAKNLDKAIEYEPENEYFKKFGELIPK